MAEINNNNNKIMVPQVIQLSHGKVLRISKMYVSVEILILDVALYHIHLGQTN